MLVPKQSAGPLVVWSSGESFDMFASFTFLSKIFVIRIATIILGDILGNFWCVIFTVKFPTLRLMKVLMERDGEKWREKLPKDDESVDQIKRVDAVNVIKEERNDGERGKDEEQNSNEKQKFKRMESMKERFDRIKELGNKCVQEVRNCFVVDNGFDTTYLFDNETSF